MICAGAGGADGGGVVLTFRTSDGPRAILQQLAAVMTLLGAPSLTGAPHPNPAPRGATEAELDALPVTICPAGGADDALCPICFDPLREGEELCALGCKHAMHAAHLRQALAVHAWCPICRTRMEGVEDEPRGCSVM